MVGGGVFKGKGALERLEPAQRAIAGIRSLGQIVANEQAPSDNWGKELAGIRDKKGISQRQAAEDIQMNRGCLRRIEAENKGDIGDFMTYAKYLGYEFDLMLVE
jgi:DNA-binding XRE family transcriptional regulator